MKEAIAGNWAQGQLVMTTAAMLPSCFSSITTFKESIRYLVVIFIVSDAADNLNA